MATTQKRRKSFDVEQRSTFEPQLLSLNIGVGQVTYNLQRKKAVEELGGNVIIPMEKVKDFVNLMRDRFRSKRDKTRSGVMLRMKDGLDKMERIPEKEVTRILRLAQKGAKDSDWLVQEYSIWVAQRIFNRSEGRLKAEFVPEALKVFVDGARKNNYHVVRGEAIQAIFEVAAYSSSLVKKRVPNVMALINEFMSHPMHFGYGGITEGVNKPYYKKLEREAKRANKQNRANA